MSEAGAAGKKNGRAVAQRLLCGGVAGTLAKTVTAPLDLTKIRFQVSWAPVTAANVFRHMSESVRQHGVLSLWRGNGAAALRVFPYASVQLSSNDAITGWLRKRRAPGPLTLLDRMVAGAGAGLLSVMATYPLDLVRARLAVQGGVAGGHHGVYRGSMDALHTILSKEGVRGLYRGAPATLLGIVPYSATSFGVFSSLKATISARTGRDPTTTERLLCGGLAGLLGQTAGYPLDVIRRRQQTAFFLLQSGSTSGPEGPLLTAGAADARQGIRSTIQSIVRAEGWGALWKGVTLNWVKGPIAVAVSFATFDALKQVLGLPDESR